MKRLMVLALIVGGPAVAGEDEGAPLDTPEAAVEMIAEAESTVVELPPRERYNQGLDRLVAGDDTAAAEDFLAARDTAGPDPELRYRAAFNLGVALAAGVAADTPPEAAIETLRESAAWFNDAARLAPIGDDDARINLELVSKRILVLADQLNDGDRLESRLDRLTDDQRGIRDQVRQLLAGVEAEGAGTEPLGFKSEFDALASRERTLMAEIGETIDLAAEERLFIEQLPDDQRTPEQQGRAYQLAGVTDYLERARQSLNDARRLLRRLTGERAHRRADAALAEMKRAREQLFDPVTVLKAVGRDQSALIGHTQALAALAGAIRLQQGPPPWLTGKHLAERQLDAAARTGGVLGRFDAYAADDVAVANAGQGRTVRAVATATPILDAGLAAMRAAIGALESDDAATALPEQDRAQAALREAIEQFADVRDLIEIAYAGQQGIVSLLTPEEDASVAALAPAERGGAISAIANANQRRLERLGALLQEETDAIAAQVASDGAVADAADEQAGQAEAERYRLASALRTTALAGLATLMTEVEAILGGAGQETLAREAAGETLTALAELRRLFFSIVEHLRELHAEQTSTHDTTATLQFEASADAADALVAGLGLVAERQSGHAHMADAVATALAEQADATNATTAEQGSPASAEQVQDAAARLIEAAEEVRKAGGRMHGADALLTDAAARASNMSPELEPALTDQVAAIEHLENALRALSPPSEDQQGQDGEQQQQQQAQPGPPEDEQMSQRQALRRLQAIRDREAERQRRRQDDGAGSEPVEKDW